MAPRGWATVSERALLRQEIQEEQRKIPTRLPCNNNPGQSKRRKGTRHIVTMTSGLLLLACPRILGMTHLDIGTKRQPISSVAFLHCLPSNAQPAHSQPFFATFSPASSLFSASMLSYSPPPLFFVSRAGPIRHERWRLCRRTRRGRQESQMNGDVYETVQEEDSRKYAEIMREVAERFTAGEEIYRSETGLKMAVAELNSLEATAQMLQKEEEEAKIEEAEQQAEAERLRAIVMRRNGTRMRRSSSSAKSDQLGKRYGGDVVRDEEGMEGQSMRSAFESTHSSAFRDFSEGLFSSFQPDLPDFLDVKTMGLMGRWEEIGGNFLLRPPDHETSPPKAVLHFLGGAFVGAAPHLTYRYLLTGLAEQGYLVVATPYHLSFDYVQVCDTVLERFERVAIPLAKEYGALPVVGIGHSCGALLQVLITCLFPDTPRLANALISFNNQMAQKAIPAFEELVVPLSLSLMGEDGLGAETPGMTGEGGALGPGTALRQSLGRLRQNFEEVVEAYAVSPFAPSVIQNEVVPLVKQAMSVVDQLPPLLQSISDGAREFAPTPDDTREVCRRMYRARRTLLVRFEDDSIDESENLMKVLQESRSIMRMKRPLVKMDVRLETIKGTHITPLTQDIFQNPPQVVDVLNPFGPPVRRFAQQQFLTTVRSVQALLVEWLEEGLVR